MSLSGGSVKRPWNKWGGGPVYAAKALDGVVPRRGGSGNGVGRSLTEANPLQTAMHSGDKCWRYFFGFPAEWVAQRQMQVTIVKVVGDLFGNCVLQETVCVAGS